MRPRWHRHWPPGNRDAVIIVHFSTRAGELDLHVWLIIILLSITAPFTTVVLAWSSPSDAARRRRVAAAFVSVSPHKRIGTRQGWPWRSCLHSAINPSRPSSTPFIEAHYRSPVDQLAQPGQIPGRACPPRVRSLPEVRPVRMCGCLRVRCEKRSVSACAGISHRHAAMTWAERLKRVCV